MKCFGHLEHQKEKKWHSLETKKMKQGKSVRGGRVRKTTSTH